MSHATCYVMYTVYKINSNCGVWEIIVKTIQSIIKQEELSFINSDCTSFTTMYLVLQVSPPPLK